MSATKRTNHTYMSIHKPRNPPHTLYAGQLVSRAMEQIDVARLHPNMKWRRGFSTKNALYEKTGIKVRTMAEWFNGRNRIPVKSLDKLLLVLDLDMLDCLTAPDIVEAMRRDPLLYQKVIAMYRKGMKQPKRSPMPPMPPEPPQPEAG